jgi:endonuclease/exonuclease/phosphatase family metal-dependent hydrolase
MKWFLRLFFLSNLALAAVTILSYFSSQIEPGVISIFSYLALMYPIFVILNLLFVILWIFIDAKFSLISILALALGYNHVSSYFGFRGNKLTSSSHDISVISFNIGNAVAAYDRDKETKLDKATKMEAFLTRFQDEDILCLQEVGDYAIDVLKKPFKGYNLHRFEKGTVIITKHEILKKGHIEFGTKTNSCLWADILIGIDTVRVYNLHLQSNRISADANEMANKQLNRNEWSWKIKRILNRYGSHHITRTKQARMVKEHANLSPHSVILCGDFNDVPLSYNYMLLRKGLVDTFKDKGAGLGTTFNGVIPLLRIDYILVAPKFQVSKFNIIKEKYSDHFPIATLISLKEYDRDKK